MKQTTTAKKYRKAGLAVRKLAVALNKLQISEKGSKSALRESEGNISEE